LIGDVVSTLGPEPAAAVAGLLQLQSLIGNRKWRGCNPAVKR